MNGLGLFAGIGGFELGLQLAIDGYKTACYVEKDEACIGILKSRIIDGYITDSPIWDDIKTFDGGMCKGVDIVTAGFPCQPFSTASHGRKTAEDLWPEAYRIIQETKSRYAFCENVRPEPIRKAAQDLSDIGYMVTCCRFSSASLGAPYIRERFWLLAYSDKDGKPSVSINDETSGLHEIGRSFRWQNSPSGVLGMDARLSNRMDRLSTLGNSVVPIVAAKCFVHLYGRIKDYGR